MVQVAIRGDPERPSRFGVNTGLQMFGASLIEEDSRKEIEKIFIIVTTIILLI